MSTSSVVLRAYLVLTSAVATAQVPESRPKDVGTASESLPTFDEAKQNHKIGVEAAQKSLFDAFEVRARQLVPATGPMSEAGRKVLDELKETQRDFEANPRTMVPPNGLKKDWESYCRSVKALDDAFESRMKALSAEHDARGDAALVAEIQKEREHHAVWRLGAVDNDGLWLAVDSVWRGWEEYDHTGKKGTPRDRGQIELRVTKRVRDNFEGKFEYSNKAVDVVGSVVRGRVSWKARSARSDAKDQFEQTHTGSARSGVMNTTFDGKGTHGSVHKNGVARLFLVRPKR